MRLKTITALSAAAALATVPTMASAASNPAQSLSIAPSVRAHSASKDKNDLTGNGRIIAIVLAAGVVVGGIIAVADSNNNPASN